MKKVFLTAALAAAALLSAGTARADNYLTPGEIEVGDRLGSAICSYIDSHGVTSSSVMTMFNAIYPEPAVANYGDVADVINYAVETYCPSHWRELVSFGSAARAAG